MGRNTGMSRRPVYVVDDQKRVTLGSLVEPSARFEVTAEEEDLILTPHDYGRVKVDGRRRLPLGRMALAGAMFRADPYPDGRIVLSPLLLVDPAGMDADLIAAIQDHLVT